MNNDKKIKYEEYQKGGSFIIVFSGIEIALRRVVFLCKSSFGSVIGGSSVSDDSVVGESIEVISINISVFGFSSIEDDEELFCCFSFCL